MHELGVWNQSSEQTWEHQVYVLDCTTAWVCSDVPDAMLVKAQAASNCREGLQNRERDKDKWSTWEKYMWNKKKKTVTGRTCRLYPDSAPGWAEYQTWSGRQWEGCGHSTAASCKRRSTILNRMRHTAISHILQSEETLTKHWTVITKHHDEYEPLLTWRPERRWAECPGYHWSHSTNIHRDQTPH